MATVPPRLAIVSDARPGRNGVGTYYSDLVEHLAPYCAAIDRIWPAVENNALAPWLSMALPGDPTQQLELPSPVALRRRLHDFRPDAVIVATPGPYGLLGARVANSLGARLVAGLHTDFEALGRLYWGPVTGYVNRRCIAGLHRWLFSRADCVVANAPGMVDLARRNGVRDARLVGTLLPLDFLEQPTAPVAGDLRHVVFIGRLATEKRVERVIDAARRLPAIDFTIAGEGPLRAEVEAAAEALPNLFHGGWLDRASIRAMLDRADLLVLPSDVEAFGTVALEALARERLALVSAGCGIRDWPELAVGLHEMQPAEDLADAIQRLAAIDPARRREDAARARAAVQAMTAATRDQWLAILRGAEAGLAANVA